MRFEVPGFEFRVWDFGVRVKREKTGGREGKEREREDITWEGEGGDACPERLRHSQMPCVVQHITQVVRPTLPEEKGGGAAVSTR